MRVNCANHEKHLEISVAKSRTSSRTSQLFESGFFHRNCQANTAVVAQKKDWLAFQKYSIEYLACFHQSEKD